LIFLKVPDWNFGASKRPFTKTVGKAQALWNCQNRRSVAANQIKEAVGKKLKTPGVTRWNSFYDSCVMLHDVLVDPDKKDALNKIISKQAIGLPFYDVDIDLLAQYCKIMQPVATCLDILQSEENAFMGILLPNLRLMQEELIGLKTDTSIKEGQALVNYLLVNPQNPKIAFRGRFEHMFQDEDLLMATALHPHFKLVVVGHICPDKKEVIRERVINEVRNKVDLVVNAVDVEQPVSRTDRFKHWKGQGEVIEGGAQNGLKSEIEGTYASWNRGSVDSEISISCNHFPLLQRSAWLHIFSKYNTPLPSSAAVERMFSFGSDILRPKRSTLTATNFETLVFVKGNSHLICK
jgi:hypothetical protein